MAARPKDLAEPTLRQRIGGLIPLIISVPMLLLAGTLGAMGLWALFSTAFKRWLGS